MECLKTLRLGHSRFFYSDVVLNLKYFILTQTLAINLKGLERLFHKLFASPRYKQFFWYFIYCLFCLQPPWNRPVKLEKPDKKIPKISCFFHLCWLGPKKYICNVFKISPDARLAIKKTKEIKNFNFRWFLLVTWHPA